MSQKFELQYLRDSFLNRVQFLTYSDTVENKNGTVDEANIDR